LFKLKKKKQGGWIVSTELIVLMTCCMCAVIIACASFGAKLVGEWGDIGSAVGSLNQSYSTSGMAVYHANDPVHNANNPVARWAGSTYTDFQDFCDTGNTCGVVMCIPPTPEPPRP